MAFTGFLATVQAALKVVAQLWDAPLAVDENADVKPFSGSTSSATLPLTETKESCSTKLQMLRSFTRTNKVGLYFLEVTQVTGILMQSFASEDMAAVVHICNDSSLPLT